MRIFITGGTGFVGRSVVAYLQSRGVEVCALVRRSGALAGVSELVGNATDLDQLSIEPLRDCQAAIHLIGIIREFPRRGVTFQHLHVEATRQVIAACQRAGVQRLVHMSALGADRYSAAQYQRTKAAAEALVRASGLDWTIIRPSVILGPDGEFFHMIRGMIRRRIVLLLGDGGFRLAPVSVNTVANAFVHALEAPQSHGKSYDLGGETITYRELLRRLASIMEKRINFLNLPVAWLNTLASGFDRFSWFPLTREQIAMSLASALPQDNDIYRDLQLNFINLDQVLRAAWKVPLAEST